MDFRGLVNPDPGCAPELTPAVLTDLRPGDPAAAASRARRSRRAPRSSIDLDRHRSPRCCRATGCSWPAVTPRCCRASSTPRSPTWPRAGWPRVSATTLANNGVPFVFVDRGVRNSLRYFYTVTAFDVNSLVSGPSSLESARVTKAVTPTPAVSNDTTAVADRSRRHRRPRVSSCRQARLAPDDRPGHRDVQRPVPAGQRRRRWSSGRAGAVIVGTRGRLSARLDSITLGSAYQGIPHLYWFTAGALGLDPATSTIISLPILQPEETGVTTAASSFQAQPVDGRQGRQVRRERRLRAARRSRVQPGRARLPDASRAWLCERADGLRRRDGTATTTGPAGSWVRHRPRTRPWPTRSPATPRTPAARR